MSETATDFYHKKTDAELLFFVEHPDYYQPSVVDAARGELKRRGLLPTVSPDTPAYVPVETKETSSKTGAVVLLAAVLAIGAGTFHFIKQKNDAAAAAKAAAARVPHTAPQLTEVATSVIPSYEGVVAGCVEQQLKRMPAAEKADAKHLRQFRELAKRFWSANAQTEYLTNQAEAAKAGPMFADQALVVRETWRAWNHAAVYSYGFRPAMQSQYDLMAKAASSQQHILDNLPDLLPGRKFLTDKEMVSRTAEVQDILGGLVRVSPVTGRAYKRTVLKM
ncbi:hypothetical protein AUC43_11275 [Hymenobacter sedentarius]|uniref:Uncharacterized protein n=1 Tax=Hymenobacter sedentarius TaxID=1411621 RepID=A0A0U4BQB4_9BACT|nr:hypothetical protein [Hymenobacter sedentarius]ALW85623.1 hypothetical protein AUC43_11275 [Hymenobacter sedentarius]